MQGKSTADDGTVLPRDTADLLERVGREWDKLISLIDSMSEEQMVVTDAGRWSTKDNLAHLTEWENWLRFHHLRNLPPHEVMRVDYQTFEKLDGDQLNDILYRRNKQRALGEIIADSRRTHEELLADLKTTPFADLMKIHYEDDPEKRPVMAWVIGNTYDHYKEHRAAIEKIAEKTKK